MKISRPSVQFSTDSAISSMSKIEREKLGQKISHFRLASSYTEVFYQKKKPFSNFKKNAK